MATETGVGLSEFSDIVEHEFGMDNGDDIEEDFVSARKRKRPCALPTLQFTLIDIKTFVFSSFFFLPNMWVLSNSFFWRCPAFFRLFCWLTVFIFIKFPPSSVFYVFCLPVYLIPFAVFQTKCTFNTFMEFSQIRFTSWYSLFLILESPNLQFCKSAIWSLVLEFSYKSGNVKVFFSWEKTTKTILVLQFWHIDLLIVLV